MGEKAASETALLIKVAAHADEVADIEAAKEIAAGIEGLRDGRVDPVDVAHFKRAARLTKRSAEHAHDIGDVVS